MPKPRLLSWRCDGCHPPVYIKVYLPLHLALFSLHDVSLGVTEEQLCVLPSSDFLGNAISN